MSMILFEGGPTLVLLRMITLGQAVLALLLLGIVYWLGS